MNKVIISGNLTRDPEHLSFGEDKDLTKFTVASSRKFRAHDEMKEETTYADCSVWGQTAVVCNKYLAKGSKVLVEGYLKTDSWEDKEGNKRSKLTVVCINVEFLSKPVEKVSVDTSGDEMEDDEEDLEDVPF